MHGGDPELLVAPGHIAWPAEYPGTSSRVVPVTLVNTGSAAGTVSGASKTDGHGDFSALGNTCTTIGLDESCVIYVGFKPTTSGSRTGTLTIEDSTSSRIHSVDLSGSGIAGHTSWAMHSEPEDYIGGGTDWSYTPADATITASGDEGHVNVRVSSGGESWTADFQADSGGLLLPGTTFTGVTRYPFNSSSAPGMAVSGLGRGCNTLTGTFTIHEAAYNGGLLRKLSVTFEQHCEGAEPALHGSIAWKADHPAKVAIEAEPKPEPEPELTTLSLTTNKRTYDFGESARVVVHLGATGTAGSVSVYATAHGVAPRLIKSGAVNSDGQLTVSARVFRRTTFTVEYVGNPVASGVAR